MARAHAANACVQSDSIKGLAQSIAKPAYHRLLIAEPALRRAVPTLIIAFLITICLGAFVQVVDQNRQKRASMKRDLAAIADVLAERSTASLRSGRTAAATFERLQLPAARPDSVLGRSPPAGMSSSPAPTSACSPAADRRRDRRHRRHSRHHQRGAAAGRAGPAQRRHRHHPAQRQRRAGDPAHRQSRCPARSSSSRKGSIRSGDRTRRCR